MDENRKHVLFIAAKNLPLQFFDDQFTQKYFQDLNGTRKYPRKNSLRQIIISEHVKMQDKLEKILCKNNSALSFTIDGWTSGGFKSYYGVTVHFLNESWKLISVALDMIPASRKHTGKDIAQLFSACLSKYNILDKIQGVTVDNASVNTTFLAQFQSILRDKGVNFNATDQHFRCFAHILNLGVQDTLKFLRIKNEKRDKLTIDCDERNQNCSDDVENLSSDQNSSSDDDDFDDVISNNDEMTNVITKVRKVCKKIRLSVALADNLKDFCTALKIKFMKPILDCKTRWNSSCDMLEVFLRLKSAINMLIENSDALADYKFSASDWDAIETIINYLKIFKQVSNILSGQCYATLPIAVVALNLLIDRVEKTVEKLDNKADRNILDETLLLAFQHGRDKILKHYKKCNWVYCVSLILDPRHKLRSFSMSDWGKQLEKSSFEYFKKMYKEIYYNKFLEKDQEIPKKRMREDSDLLDLKSIYANRDTCVPNWEKEINEYIEAPCASDCTDILNWWRDHQNVYPILAKMAKDVLAIMATSVPVERLFSNASLIVTDKRKSLKDDALVSLLTINSWMKSELAEEICGFSDK